MPVQAKSESVTLVFQPLCKTHIQHLFLGHLSLWLLSFTKNAMILVLIYMLLACVC